MEEDFLSGKELTIFKDFEKQMEEHFEKRETEGEDMKEERAFCSPYCLRRYLRARSFKIKDAEKMLLATLQWRREFRPQDILPDHVGGVVSLNTVFIHGRDLLNRPVIYMKPGAQNPYPAEQVPFFFLFLFLLLLLLFLSLLLLLPLLFLYPFLLLFC